MKMKMYIMFLLLTTLFLSNTKAQIPGHTLRYFSVLAEGNLVDNNPQLIKGIVGVYGNVTGTNANADSVVRMSSTIFSNAIAELTGFKNYLNAKNGTAINTLDTEINAGIYKITSNYITSDYQVIKFVGNSTDTIIINIDGDLIINESTNIVLQGVKPENIFWNISGDLKIKTRSWVYGTFFTTGDIVIYNDVEGAISTFSESDITIGATSALASNHFLTISIDIGNDIPCAPTCIATNLISNGEFSNAPMCNDNIFANDFDKDLRYKQALGIDPCNNPSSRTSFYKIDNNLDSWNSECNSSISDHTGNGGNLFFVDGFGLYRPINATSAEVFNDTNNVVIWKYSMPVETGKSYSFSFWSTNINMFQDYDFKLRFTIDGIEIPNTRYTIPGDDIKWRQHCFTWTAPGTLGGTIGITLEIRQVDLFSIGGMDIVIDDIIFGEMISEPILITSTVTSNYCTGNNTTLSVVNPIIGYSYQWRLNGTTIPGATGSSYIAMTNGSYSVIGLSNSVVFYRPI